MRERKRICWRTYTYNVHVLHFHFTHTHTHTNYRIHYRSKAQNKKNMAPSLAQTSHVWFALYVRDQTNPTRQNNANQTKHGHSEFDWHFTIVQNQSLKIFQIPTSISVFNIWCVTKKKKWKIFKFNRKRNETKIKFYRRNFVWIKSKVKLN